MPFLFNKSYQMDERFIKYIDDVIQDEWNLGVMPEGLSLQRDSDYLDNYDYMNTRTKVAFDIMSIA